MQRSRASGPTGRLPVALGSPAFVRLWIGSILSSVGTQMSNVAKVWLLFELTRSAAALGLEGLCFAIPIAVLPLIGGPIVDRLDRLTVIRAGLVVEAAEAVALTTVTATGDLQPWMIYLAAAFAAGRLSFVVPAGTAVIPSLVPESGLQSAMSLGAIVWSSSSLIGPALAGALLGVVPAGIVFAINAVATLIALLVIRPVTGDSLRRPTAHQESESRPADGVRYLLRHRYFLGLQALIFLSSTLLIGTETLLPILDVQVWGGGTLEYGLLRTAPGIAAVVAGVALSLCRPSPRPFRAVAIGLVVACAGLAVFVRLPTLGLAFAVLALASSALVGTQILVTTCIQQDTPDRLRGAVGGVTVIGQSGLAGIAAAAMAVTAGVIGASSALTITTAAVLPMALACAAYARRQRRQHGRRVRINSR